jgi:acetyl esterase/lipase
VPSSAPEVAPFPAGLNDCVSGLMWVLANAGHLNIDPARVIVAGESGGGNLTLATGLKLKQDGELGLNQGPLRAVPVYRRPVADAGVPVLDRKQRDPARPA